MGARFGAAQSGPFDGAHGSAHQQAKDDIGDGHKGHEEKCCCRVKERCQSSCLGLRCSIKVAMIGNEGYCKGLDRPHPSAKGHP